MKLTSYLIKAVFVSAVLVMLAIPSFAGMGNGPGDGTGNGGVGPGDGTGNGPGTCLASPVMTQPMLLVRGGNGHGGGNGGHGPGDGTGNGGVGPGDGTGNGPGTGDCPAT